MRNYVKMQNKILIVTCYYTILMQVTDTGKIASGIASKQKYGNFC